MLNYPISETLYYLITKHIGAFLDRKDVQQLIGVDSSLTANVSSCIHEIGAKFATSEDRLFPTQYYINAPTNVASERSSVLRRTIGLARSRSASVTSSDCGDIQIFMYVYHRSECVYGSRKHAFTKQEGSPHVVLGDAHTESYNAYAVRTAPSMPSPRLTAPVLLHLQTRILGPEKRWNVTSRCRLAAAADVARIQYRSTKL
ncbi:hypothetical protein NM688_g7818 [Phlebia brevispora]|uniref:Uncharacterized protein n=1 Tax=Phlebia brevispora TaxID=194682 RepID=A0ACC1S0U8_9APHY|nr:hypothetical protein NM688_g7818 [Phlebia brevispora]